MGKKFNTEFLEAYIDLDSACAKALDVNRSGVTEYINRLKSDPYISPTDETLKRLIGYRKTRNKLAHEEGALADMDEIDKSDIRWLKDFCKAIIKGKDPLSLAHRELSLKKIVLWGAAAVCIVIAIIAILLITK